jgi:hypothetical protein
LERHPLRGLFTATGARSFRASSWDPTGGNRDFLTIEPGQTATLLELAGPGCVTHVYCALAFYELTDYRDAILRCYWDGEATPSVEVPLGDFFGVTHGRVRPYRSQVMAVNEGGGCSYGLNCYFPMPFAHGARITLENRGDRMLGGVLPAFWYHIEYETYAAPPPEKTLRFHAQWRQERLTEPVGERPNRQLHGGSNIGGAENYVALEATGEGQMAGLVLEVNNVAGGWYGEGDDMVFIDDDTWPPSIHGTGSEEVFGGGACPSVEYAGQFSGFHLIQSADYAGLVGMYRWYVPDPIRFTRSIRWTIEHGHANNFANGYSSVAYWYQGEPHAPFPPLPPRDEMRPPLPAEYEEARDAVFGALGRAIEAARTDPARFFRTAAVADPFYRGHFDDALRNLAADGLA